MTYKSNRKQSRLEFHWVGLRAIQSRRGVSHLHREVGWLCFHLISFS